MLPLLRASWQLSAGVGVLLFAGYVVCRLISHPRLASLQAFCLQFGVVVAIFAVYQHSAHIAFNMTDGAQQRAAGVWHLERQLHLPSELAVQQWVLPYPALVRVLNAYYAGLHLTSMTVFLIWMWWRHRAYYVLACVTVAGTTLVCVSMQHIPVAPPRLMPGLGFVDTGLLYGQSMYGPRGQGIAAQLAAMPSIHVAWAAIIAGFAVMVSTSLWRWVLVAHFVMTFIVVVATANHWWMDGVVGIGIAALVFAAAKVVLRPSDDVDLTFAGPVPLGEATPAP
ncbi:MAG: phosphatase PAP2 family protein [Actinomycetes bacterium]